MADNDKQEEQQGTTQTEQGQGGAQKPVEGKQEINNTQSQEQQAQQREPNLAVIARQRDHYLKHPEDLDVLLDDLAARGYDPSKSKILGPMFNATLELVREQAARQHGLDDSDMDLLREFKDPDKIRQMAKKIAERDKGRDERLKKGKPVEDDEDNDEADGSGSGAPTIQRNEGGGPSLSDKLAVALRKERAKAGS